MSRAPFSNLPAPPAVTTRGWDDMDERKVLEYRPETDTYWARLDKREPAYLEIISAVATISGVSPEELPVIYTEIGKEGMAELESLEVTEAVLGDATVVLVYADHEVTVYSDGAIAVKHC